MMVSIRDQNALAELLPSDITTYLCGHGWQQAAEIGAIATWEISSSKGIADVDVPLRHEWRDYSKRVQDVVRTIAAVEERSELDVYHDISVVSYDIVRLIARDQGIGSDGTIPLNDGIGLVSAGKGSLLSAACAAITPKRAYHTRKPPQAVAFAESLRMGQSERGSYIVTVLSRIPKQPKPHQTAFKHPEFDPSLSEVPFERRVTETLGNALARMQTAAHGMMDGRDISAFEESVEYGVSADLCESVALVQRCASVSELEISISWALTRPLNKPVPSRVTFNSNTIGVIANAGRVLREREPVDDFELEGPVINVSRPDQLVSGKVTLYGIVDGSQRKVTVELSGDDWQKANTAIAQQDRAKLSCVGKLERNGRAFVLLNPRNVQILYDDA